MSIRGWPQSALVTHAVESGEVVVTIEGKELSPPERATRLNGSFSMRAAVCAETCAPVRRRIADMMSTAVGGWVALGARMRCGSASEVEK